MRPFVSVVIPCRNEAASIVRCLDSVFASQYPPARLEVIVADGMSTDGTRALLARYPGLRLLDNPGRTAPAALNLAIRGARGDLILRVDAHSAIAPDYIARLAAFLETHPDAWGAGGLMITAAETAGPFASAITAVLSHRFGVGNSSFRTSEQDATEPFPVDTVFNCCWRREVFGRAGWFDERLARSQDIEFSSRIARAGGTLWLVPGARTVYYARTRFADYLRHNWSNGVWSVLPAAYTSTLPVRWRHLVPLAFVLALAASLAAGLLAGVPWLALVPALPYALANLAASIQAAWRRRSPGLALLLPAVFAGLHLTYGAGSLWGLFRAIPLLWRKPAPELARSVPTT